ncbi:TetR/AcrR family transcriptional regulator [Prauserella muralis]|uniref:TetR family transcriptional regulator n=1 Tax=Prauserella muralis TaxID=588067 RepID=A0A2V4AYB3_9PSEU|nr:TetR/AcrR family transcriptional regulator [Prauserella muralis]PXY26904.1 TetR family transcriptional regulator [Prauserella muralis]TWE23489.1 TetR family transcriptional regulator [Prauserella muralis]
MPRGVAIPEIRQHLFAAAEQVIVRDGPAKLSGRAVTGQAGVASGLLYAHFADLDEFLAAYAVDRGFLVSAEAANLPRRAGSGSVAGNLCDAVLATPPVTLPALTRLLVSRPELTGRVRAVLGERTAGLDAIEGAAATYLRREQRLGRVVEAADPGALALTLVGVVHHVMLTAPGEADARTRIRDVVTALVTGLSSGDAPQLRPVTRRGGRSC